MTQTLYPNQNNSHGLACDGLQIAKDDMREIEHMQKREEAEHELFQNAARIRGAMKSNRLLRPIFRKYKRACREILQQKNDEVIQLTTLCDYCDSCNNNGNNNSSNHDLKCIQYEMREIHDKIKSLEEMQLDTDSSDSESDFDSDNEYAEEAADDDGDAEDDDHDEDEDEDSNSVSSASSASSASSVSSLGDLLDMENFT